MLKSMTNPIFILLVFGFISLTVAAESQNVIIPPLSNINSVDDIVKPYVALETTKAISIATIKNGEIAYYNYGVVSDRNPIPPTEQSLYEIGSITKTFTAAVLAQMTEEGKLQLDDPISKFLPNEVANWDKKYEITLLELTTHSSGFPRSPGNYFWQAIFNLKNPYSKYAQKHLYKYLKKYQPVPKSERKPAYSNLGTGLLGNILAEVDGISYEQMINTRIFKPLNMDNSCINLDNKSLIQGHNSKGKPTSQWDFSVLEGAGAIRSTTADMIKYIQANLEEKPPFVNTHKAQKSFSPTRDIGLAWIIEKEHKSGLDIVWHNGGTGGFKSFTGFVKDQQIGVVVLTNASESMNEIGIRVLEFLNQK